MKYVSIKKAFVCISLLSLAVGCNKTQPQPVPQAPPVSIPAPTPVVTKPDTPTQSGKPPQFVVLAFDGSYSLDMWKNTLDFAAQMQAENKPIHFTYFLSGVYFLNYRKAVKYQPPLYPAGKSMIGFGLSNLDVEKRAAYVNQAIAEGHEIGSHANGHFDGSSWTQENWDQEFSEFEKLIFSIDSNNDVEAKDADRYKLNMNKSDLIGFRAPALGKSSGMYEALVDHHFAYDTSGIGKPDAWPTKLPSGLWEFPLASINYNNTTSKILSMDYNFYYKQSQAKDVALKGSAQWQSFFDATYASYISYFNQNYEHNRAPVYIGSHFSEWNDGVYWEAMKKFAEDVCGQPEVRCISFKELMEYLDTHPQK